jgi:hypothetical protein
VYHGGQYEVDCLQGYWSVQSGVNRPTFQRRVLQTSHSEKEIGFHFILLSIILIKMFEIKVLNYSDT